ncbi:MAG: DUF2799 domain-containing protein [Methylotenera sp.]|nr:DUF2799 domain-containing protein [Oligoflexia bacterium]
MTTSLTTRSLLTLALTGLMGLTACSHGMSKQDCESADFYQMGLEDGKDGKTTDRLQQMKGQCSGQGVAIAEDKYNYGRQVGLANYCDAGRAKNDVKDGKNDSICMKDKVPPYQSAYTQEVNNLRAKNAKELQDLEKSQAKIQQKKDELNRGQSQLDQQAGSVPTN